MIQVYNERDEGIKGERDGDFITSSLHLFPSNEPGTENHKLKGGVV
jgi:hypothetical protein